MRYGLLGEKLGHSFSKEIHEKLGRYSYELIEVPRDRIDAFMTAREFVGLNVTIPYKQTVIPYLDEISPRARAIGAVNTIVNRGGKLYGDNTDFGGMKLLIERMTPNLRDQTVLVCGTGGTSRTAVAVAEALGADAAKIHRLSRSGKDGALSYEDAYAFAASAGAGTGEKYLINTTPCGMYPDVEGCPVDLSRLPGLTGVADVIYNPLTTKLVRLARERGLPSENGLYMLVAQAVLAAEIFTNAPFPAGTIDRVYGELLFEKRNIVLTGMPSSGKSTVGRRLAKRLGRELIDTDAEIVKRAGTPITEIFKTHGEAYFRDLETETIKELSRTGGRVIATGGGAVLRKENIDVLKLNGTVVVLDRPLADLLPTDDRPLSNDETKLRSLYAERHPIYTAAADVAVPVRGTPEDTVNEVMEKLTL